MIDEGALDALVEEAIKPYVGMMPAETLAQMRIVLRLTLQHHPDAAPLTAATVPRKAVESGAALAKSGAR